MVPEQRAREHGDLGGAAGHPSGQRRGQPHEEVADARHRDERGEDDEQDQHRAHDADRNAVEPFLLAEEALHHRGPRRGRAVEDPHELVGLPRLEQEEDRGEREPPADRAPRRLQHGHDEQRADDDVAGGDAVARVHEPVEVDERVDLRAQRDADADGVHEEGPAERVGEVPAAEREEEERQDQHEGQVRRAVRVHLGLAVVRRVEVEQAERHREHDDGRGQDGLRAAAALEKPVHRRRPGVDLGVGDRRRHASISPRRSPCSSGSRRGGTEWWRAPSPSSRWPGRGRARSRGCP